MKYKKVAMKYKYVLFFLPSFVLVAFFYLGPGIITVWYAFTNKTLTDIHATQYRFVGFENFINMFRDPRVGGAAMRTLIFLVFSGLIGQQVLGLLLAMLQKNRNKTFIRIVGIIVIISWIAPEVVGAFCLYAFFGNNGTLNAILSRLLNIEGITWLFSFPMTTVTIANIWRGTAFSMMIYRAALSSIPIELEEYAYLEGIGIWQKVRFITLPLIKETIVTNSILVTLSTMGGIWFNLFAHRWRSQRKVSNPTTLLYDRAMVRFQIGYGTAISLVLLIFSMALTLLYMRSAKQKI